ncbi:16S rRNA pseudouridine(516) synthase [Methylobacterium oryzihabitans]|uniref:Pseudouridine synthase n=1 Tax=Methylobacterium oryzihabitans TaxID=2499852 RepID=A0A3S2XLY3_9HYPH|nr:16S rRNA pseudouridine(516) synthase [Methylobacterium oryzihabitans]RVU18027.1 16S rRNA pseudouridine(516) synthase [Methylobacterium oryzihabitans]
MSASVRLDRLLANLGYGSRREIQALAHGGAIRLNGAVLGEADRRIAVTPDLPERMTVRGEPVDPPPGLVLMLHKPLGATCSHKEAGPLVYGLLPERWRRRDPALSTVGRLDKDTSGLLLLTDDGALLHRIIAPKAKVTKRYRVVLARPLRGDEAEVFASGTLMLDGEDKPLLPAALTVEDSRRASLVLGEGRYHQVRRMFAALGNHVEALHRDRVGGLDLPGDLGPGQFRRLGPDEVARIFSEPV